MSQALTPEQSNKLWAFVRGSHEPLAFEKWFLAENGLEQVLDEELHWELTVGDYRKPKTVWPLRDALERKLVSLLTCYCPTFRDLDRVPMGGAVDENDTFLSDRVFASFETSREYGKDLWWLYASHCRTCGTDWLIAQDERHYDDWFLKRLSSQEAQEIRDGRWPDRFSTWEDVMLVGRALSTPPRFLDPDAASLNWTVQDLLKERPGFTDMELGELLGISTRHAKRLADKYR